MAFNLDSRNLEVKISGAWEDITQDVVSTFECEYGINGNSEINRVSSTGTLKFTLRNDSGCIGGVDSYYTPGSTNAKTGWDKGIPVRLVLVNRIRIVKFFGAITDISVDVWNRKVTVTAKDWMDYATKQPISLQTIEYNVGIDEIVQSVIDNMPIAPLHTEFDEGIDTFPTAFDTSGKNTKALTEFQKVALSELGYVYLRKDRTDGETLVVENRHRRIGNSILSLVPYLDGSILLEDGTKLLAEDGTLLLLDSAADAIFDNSMNSINVSYGENQTNQVVAKAYPREVGTGYEILFKISSPIFINAGETITFKGTFTDPKGIASKITSGSVLQPRPFSDYLFNSNSDGSGSDMTGGLSATAVYTTDGATYTIKNNSAFPGYLIQLYATGIPIRIYEANEYSAEDSISISENGYLTLNLDMKYQDNILIGKDFADRVLTLEENPRLLVNSIDFIANRDEALMNSFLYLDIGDLIRVKETKTGVDKYFYIQRIKYSVEVSGIIRFTWYLIEALEKDTHYWILDDSTYSILDTSTVLGY